MNSLRSNFPNTTNLLLFACILLLVGVLQPINASGFYEEAYEMEQTNTLFAIPLYEKALSQKPTGKLQKAVVSRLFFLYKKHSKLLDALFLGSRYPSHIPSKDRAWIWNQLSEIYKPISISDLSSTYVFAAKANSENTQELSDHLRNLNLPKLYEFASILLLKRKQYKLILILYEENPTMFLSPLFVGISEFKLGTEQGKEFLKKVLADSEKERSDQEKSDILYLMGVHYRQSNEHELSARYFRMSGSFYAKQRADLEASKSMVLQGKQKEMCSTFKFGASPFDEIETILYYHCSPTGSQNLRPILPSIRILSEREGNEFLQILFPKES
ncbi:hypothetical protein [Leptospira biflexa]|uniref:Tetratricopeptide repeat protein n=1 Tax=Leptospira biflexa serovar Patoc (strain Patoc 1 / ATCC 23582 / Paris) TaxID=456481 RepID=B0SKL4_LEPBP|nr:hypothetical protein [Leptospira biflexa]ABZ96771.1 Hypothetical protein; putative signal peptide [Leptospira biflexa serovar Patoc strain 'Patoc 1 (Paris)']